MKNLETWFDTLESPLIAYAYQILQDREDARDQVQEAFRRILQEKQVIDYPKAWLYRTVRNLCISHIRKTRRMQNESDEKQLDFLASKMEGEDKAENPLQKLERREKIGRVAHFISLLPEESKDLLMMKFEFKLSYKEIAEKTDLSEGNVGYKLHHLLKELALELRTEGITS